MFKKILYPTDFSKDAMKALEYVKKLRESGTEEVIILCVLHEYGLDSALQGCEWAGIEVEKCKENLLDVIAKDKEVKAQKIHEEIEATGIKGKVRLEVGNPAAKILEIADEENVSLIVMGAYGERKALGLLLGSVAEKVVRHTKVPVLIIR